MKFKLNAIASVTLLGTVLGCAPLTPVAPLARSSVAPPRGQASAVPVKVAQAPAISLAMSPGDALYTQGLSAHGAGQIALAAQHYAQALKIAPEHVGALNALAVIYAQSGRTDEALRLFAYASELAPASAHVHNNTGYALLRAGRLDEAEVALNKARELDPANAQTQQNQVLLATAKAALAPVDQAVQANAGDPAGPRLVAVAPNVFELRAPANTTAEAGAPARAEAELPSAKVQTVGVAASPENMPRLASMTDSAGLRGVRLEVSNGVGITRLARRTAERLASEGVVTARLTNAKPYRQANTEIQFVTGHAQAAQALQAHLPVATLAVPASQLKAGVQVRLVIGHDMAGKAITAWLDSAQEPQVATSPPGGGWRWS